jgi:hypothetical protein
MIPPAMRRPLGLLMVGLLANPVVAALTAWKNRQVTNGASLRVERDPIVMSNSECIGSSLGLCGTMS